MERSKKLINNSIILLLGTVFTKGLNFIMAPLFTRWLSQESYGTFDLISTYATLLIPILALGIHHAIFRFLLDNKSEDEITEINTNAVITNFIGIIIYIIIVTIISIINGNLLGYIIQLTILIFTQTFQNYICMVVRGLKKLKLYAIMNIICTASILAFVFVFVRKLNMGLNGMILGYSMGYFIGGLIGAIATNILYHFKLQTISKSRTKEMLKYSIPMIPQSIAWWIVNISDRVIVSVFLGAASNAILAVAHKIPNLIVTIYDVFQTAWMENASEAINDNDWDEYFNKTLNIIGQLCISISIVIVTTNFFVFNMLFTQEYGISRNLIPMLSIAIVFNVLSQILGTVFIAEYNSKQQGITMLESGVINIIVHLLLINYCGIYASVISTIVAYVFLFIIRYKKVKKKYKIKLNYKSILLILFLVICVILSYLDINIINYTMLIFSIVVCVTMNKEAILVIVKKLLKNK